MLTFTTKVITSQQITNAERSISSMNIKECRLELFSLEMSIFKNKQQFAFLCNDTVSTAVVGAIQTKEVLSLHNPG